MAKNDINKFHFPQTLKMNSVSECTLQCEPNILINNGFMGATMNHLEEKKKDVQIPEIIIDMIADYVQDKEQYIIAMNIKHKFTIEDKFLLEALKLDKIDILIWARKNGWKWWYSLDRSNIRRIVFDKGFENKWEVE